jgi:nucleotide-binding universal stress UspA family protein
MNGKTIVCGVNATAAARDAAELAAALAARLRLRLVLVHVCRDGEAAAGAAAGAEDVRLVHGRRAEALAQVAAEEGAGLIVLGSRTGRLDGSMLRSGLARELQAATAIPVLVAPPSTQARSRRRLSLAVATGER